MSSLSQPQQHLCRNLHTTQFKYLTWKRNINNTTRNKRYSWLFDNGGAHCLHASTFFNAFKDSKPKQHTPSQYCVSANREQIKVLVDFHLPITIHEGNSYTMSKSLNIKDNIIGIDLKQAH
jgi:hypothetical protein